MHGSPERAKSGARCVSTGAEEIHTYDISSHTKCLFSKHSNELRNMKTREDPN